MPWDDRGIASFRATGSDQQGALEAGLRAALALTIGDAEGAKGDLARAVPLRGEGGDLAVLFADLLDDLFSQVEEYGAALRDVAIDGVLHRDQGGFVAWGYASLAEGPFPSVTPPRLNGAPVAGDEQCFRFTIQASLIRDP